MYAFGNYGFTFLFQWGAATAPNYEPHEIQKPIVSLSTVVRLGCVFDLFSSISSLLFTSLSPPTSSGRIFQADGHYVTRNAGKHTSQVILFPLNSHLLNVIIVISPQIAFSVW